MLFLIDESGLFKFDQEVCIKKNELNLALVAGVAIPKESSQDILNYIHLNHQHNGQIIKGKDIRDDTKIERFIDQLLNKNCYAAFSPGDHKYITDADIQKYKNDWASNWESYAKQAHPE